MRHLDSNLIRQQTHNTALWRTMALSLLASEAASTPLPVREAFSGVLGSVSLACWIFLLVPQLIENYRNSSADAISLPFIFIWFLGDVANLWGAAWAGLVPVVIAIAVYFCVADGVLIGQCLYYRIVNKRKDVQEQTRESVLVDEDGEEEPLLSRQRSGSLTIPGSMKRRPSSTSIRRRSSVNRHERDTLSKILEEDEKKGGQWFRNLISILMIIAAGTAGWTIAWQSGVWKPTPQHEVTEGESMAVGAQVLGYLSAVAYLGARLPQIYKNWREKSCEGQHGVLALPVLINANIRRALATLLYAVTDGQCHLRRWHSVPFNRKAILHDESTLADRESGYDG